MKNNSADWLATLASPYPASPDFHLKVKRLTMICASLALLHPLLSLTHRIFRSLMLPYKSSSHSANHVRCAFTGKRVTRFSGRFASLRIVFPCHPCSGGRIGRSMLSCRDMAPWLSIHSPTTKWGEGGGASHQKGNAFPRAKRGWPVFRRPQGGCQGFIIRWRRRRRTSPAQRYYITPEGGALNPPVRRSRSQAEPLAPRAKGPAAPSTLARESGRQPSGIQLPAANV